MSELPRLNLREFDFFSIFTTASCLGERCMRSSRKFQRLNIRCHVGGSGAAFFR